MSDESPIDRAVREQVEANNAVVEQMCEAALLSGKHGVLVTPQPDGTVIAEVSPDVPYAEIHWKPHPLT